MKAFTVVRCSAIVERSAADTWEAIGNYADAGRFLAIPCILVAGDGGLGSIRKVGEAILEAKIGEAARSYAYVQTEGPMAPFAYHGCVAVEPRSADSCDLVYTLLFDPTTMESGREQQEVERLSKRFQGAVDSMRAHALETQAGPTPRGH